MRLENQQIVICLVANGTSRASLLTTHLSAIRGQFFFSKRREKSPPRLYAHRDLKADDNPTFFFPEYSRTINHEASIPLIDAKFCWGRKSNVSSLIMDKIFKSGSMYV